MTQDPGGITAPSKIGEGQTFDVKVGNGADQVRVSVSSTGDSFFVPVENGKAIVTSPAGVGNGAVLTITALGPSGAHGVSVQVTSGD